jgi:NAD-dependent DNA ligase
MSLDADEDEALLRYFNLPRMHAKAIAHLEGAAAAIVYDGAVSDEELVFLADWLRRHDEFRTTWPVSKLHALLTKIVEDGVVEPRERLRLFDFLESIAATPAETGTPAKSIYDEIERLAFPSRVFCFTGKMVFLGQRKKIAAAVEKQGGVVKDSVAQDLHYLVVGAAGSEQWAFGRFGRKIQRAIELRASGTGILIVREKALVASLVDPDE